MNHCEEIYEALDEIVDPCSAATGSNLTIVEMGLVKSVTISDGHAEIEIRLTSPACHMIAYFIDEVETRVSALETVDSVDVNFDSGKEWTKDMMTQEAKEQRQTMLNKYESQVGGKAAE